MGVLDWSTNPDQNGYSDPNIAAVDGAPARNFMPFIRRIMAGVARVDKNVVVSKYKSILDADYVALSDDTQIGFAVLSAPRTVTLPDVDLYPIGQVLFIADESGQCSVDRPITIAVGAGTNDTIAGQTAIQITDAYQGLGFRRGAANVWIIAR